MSKKLSFSGLTGKEVARMSRSVINQKDIGYGPRTPLQKQCTASFPVELAEYFIKLYSAKEDWVLDPFAGVGSTILACKNLDRNGIGIELYPHFADLARKALSQSTLTSSLTHLVRQDDCLKALTYLPKEKFQLTFTSPPYANSILLKPKHPDPIWKDLPHSVPYGDDPRDLGNMKYDEYFAYVYKIMEELCKVTKVGGYNVWVVRDFRDTKHGHLLRPVHLDLANIGGQVGWKLLDFIIWDQTGNRPLGVLGFPNYVYMNIGHSYIVVFRKD